MKQDEYVYEVFKRYGSTIYVDDNMGINELVKGAAQAAVMMRDSTSEIYRETAKQITNINYTGRVKFNDYQENTRCTYCQNYCSTGEVYCSTECHDDDLEENG